MNKEGIIHIQILIQPFLHTDKGIKKDDIELGYKQLLTYRELFESQDSEELFLLRWKEIGQKLFEKMNEAYNHE
jgi:hypothetical protein